MRYSLLYILIFFWLTACADESSLGLLPSISSITTKNGKAEGPISGKTEVTILGTHFADDAEVTFGGQKASAVTVQSVSSLVATTDSVFLSGLVSVAVTTGGQIASLPEAFVYTPLIAFSSDRTESFEIFTMEIDGNTGNPPFPVQLTKGRIGINNQSPVFSPDGRSILFTRNQTGDSELFLIEHNGRNPVNLTNNPRIDQEAAFSPDGKQIVFISDRLSTIDNTPSDFDLFLMDRNGGNLKQLTTNGAADRNPSFSHDGKHILFVSNRDGDKDRELFLMNTDEIGELLQLTNNVHDDHDPIFSPDGKQILFVSNRTGKDELHVIDIDGRNPLQLTTSQGKITTPAFLKIPKHGIEILFSSDQTGDKEIFLMSCSGDQARAITQCDEAGKKNLSRNIASEIDPSPSPQTDEVRHNF